MVSFQKKFVEGLIERHVQVTNKLDDFPYESVLVIGGSREIPGLLRARQKGIPIVQRLDGMNWLHRVNIQKRSKKLNLKHFLRAEYGNVMLSFIRRFIADRIVYQSNFVKQWWNDKRGAVRKISVVIHNGINLKNYRPDDSIKRPVDFFRLLMVEGNLMGGYEYGLETAVNLSRELCELIVKENQNSMELMVAGNVTKKEQDYWDQQMKKLVREDHCSINWKGTVETKEIPQLDNSAHLLFSSDINAACPNSVIEAIACGLPVLSFKTGALAELVMGDAGRLVPYGGDPWKLDPPDIKGLACAAFEILNNQEYFRNSARLLAEEKFGLNKMVEAYLEILSG